MAQFFLHLARILSRVVVECNRSNGKTDGKMRSARSGEFDAERGVPLLAYREKAEAPLPILAAGLPLFEITTGYSAASGAQQGLGRNDVGRRAVRKAVLLEPHLGMMDAVGKALLPGAAAQQEAEGGHAVRHLCKVL